MPAATRRIMPARVRRIWDTASASPGTSRTVWRKYFDQRISSGDDTRARGARGVEPSCAGRSPVGGLRLTALDGFRRGVLLPGAHLLDEAEVRPQLLHHPVLDARAALRRLRAGERDLGLLRAAR